MMSKHIPVIMFHDIADRPTEKWAIATKHFEAFLIYLKRHGFQTVHSAEVFASKDVYIPQKIMLTFDDGYASVHQLAFPLLKKYGFTATLFMTTNFIDSVVTSSGKAAPALSKDQLRELADGGWEIGSHSEQHRDLRKVSDLEKRSDLRESQKVLEGIVECPVSVYSYPHGRYDQACREALGDVGYQGAFSVFTSRKKLSFDLYAYDRLEISNKAHPLWQLEFYLKTTGEYWF